MPNASQGKLRTPNPIGDNSVLMCDDIMTADDGKIMYVIIIKIGSKVFYNREYRLKV